MGTPYISEIRIFTFNFPPKGWALCNGQTLPINQNQALFSLLGTTYGGNGTTNFNLPNLQGRVGVHQGTSPSGVVSSLGEVGGMDTVTLSIGELPAHNHLLHAVNGLANSTSVSGAAIAVPDVNARMQNLFGAGPTVVMGPSSVAATGGSQPHDNHQPTAVLSFCIALQGIFPIRS